MMASISSAEMRGPCRVQVLAAIPWVWHAETSCCQVAFACAADFVRPMLPPRSAAAISCLAEPSMADREFLFDLHWPDIWASRGCRFSNQRPIHRYPKENGARISLGRAALVFRQSLPTKQDGQGSRYSGGSY